MVSALVPASGPCLQDPDLTSFTDRLWPGSVGQIKPSLPQDVYGLSGFIRATEIKLEHPSKLSLQISMFPTWNSQDLLPTDPDLKETHTIPEWILLCNAQTARTVTMPWALHLSKLDMQNARSHSGPNETESNSNSFSRMYNHTEIAEAPILGLAS